VKESQKEKDGWMNALEWKRAGRVNCGEHLAVTADASIPASLLMLLRLLPLKTIIIIYLNSLFLAQMSTVLSITKQQLNNDSGGRVSKIS